MPTMAMCLELGLSNPFAFERVQLTSIYGNKIGFLFGVAFYLRKR
jgi:hypothetical protein